MVEAALLNAWDHLRWDILLKKDLEEGLADEQRGLLKEFTDIVEHAEDTSALEESIHDFLEEHFPHDEDNLHEFLRTISDYTLDGKPVRDPHSIQETVNFDISDSGDITGQPMDYPSWREWREEKQMVPVTRKKALTLYRQYVQEWKSRRPTPIEKPTDTRERIQGQRIEDEGGPRASVLEGLNSLEGEGGLRAIASHKRRLANMFYARMEDHNSIFFHHILRSMSKAEMKGALTGNWRTWRKISNRMREIEPTTGATRGPFESLMELDKHESEDDKLRALKKAYAVLWSDTMGAIVHSLMTPERMWRKNQEGVREPRLQFTDRDTPTFDEYFGRGEHQPVSWDTILQRRVKQGLKEGEDNLKRHMGHDYRIKLKRHESKVAKLAAKNQAIVEANSLRAQQRREGMTTVGDDESLLTIPHFDEKRYKTEAYIKRRTRLRRRLIRHHADSMVREHCLRELAMRSGMGFTTDEAGNEIAQSPMAKYLASTASVPARDGGIEDVMVGGMATVDDALDDLLDLMVPVTTGSLGVVQEEGSDFREINWNQFLHRWDNLDASTKQLAFMMVGFDSQAPIIANLLSGNAQKNLPLHPESGGPYYKSAKEKESGIVDDSGTDDVLEAFARHITERHLAAEREEKKWRNRSRVYTGPGLGSNDFLTMNSTEELVRYMKGDTKVSFKDAEGNSLRRVSIPGMWDRVLDPETGQPEVKKFTNFTILRTVDDDGEESTAEFNEGDEMPRHLQTNDMEVVLDNWAKENNRGEASLVEVLYSHFLDRLKRHKLADRVTSEQSAQMSMDLAGAGRNRNLTDWMNPETWQSLTSMVGRAKPKLPKIGLKQWDIQDWLSQRGVLRREGGARQATEAQIVAHPWFQREHGLQTLSQIPKEALPTDKNICPSCKGSAWHTKKGNAQIGKHCLGTKGTGGPLKYDCVTRKYLIENPGVLDKSWLGHTHPGKHQHRVELNKESRRLARELMVEHKVLGEKIRDAISRAAHETNIGLVPCNNCQKGWIVDAGTGKKTKCEECGGHGKIADPMIFIQAGLGVRYGDNNMEVGNPLKAEMRNSADKRAILQRRGRREEEEALIEKGVWPKTEGLPGHSYDRHAFAVLPQMHVPPYAHPPVTDTEFGPRALPEIYNRVAPEEMEYDGGPLCIQRVLALRDEARLATRDDSDSVMRVEMREYIYQRLSDEMQHIVDSLPEEYVRAFSGWNVSDAMESEHMEEMLDILCAQPKQPSLGQSAEGLNKRISEHLKYIHDPDIDGYNTNLDSGHLSDMPCSKCHGESSQCNSCQTTGKEAVRIAITRDPMLHNLPPSVIQALPSVINLSRRLSVCDSPRWQSPHGKQPCIGCNAGFGPEMHIGNQGMAHIFGFDASMKHMFTHASQDSNTSLTISSILAYKKAIEGYEQEVKEGKNPELEYVRDCLDKLLVQLTTEDQVETLQAAVRQGEMNIPGLVEGIPEKEEWYAPPKGLFSLDGKKDLDSQTCPECNRLAKAGLIKPEDCKTIGQEKEFSGGAYDFVMCENALEIRKKHKEDGKGSYKQKTLKDCALNAIGSDEIELMEFYLNATPDVQAVRHGIDHVRPFLEELDGYMFDNREAVGNRLTGMGVSLPEIRHPLPQTLLALHMNDPTGRHHLSKVSGDGAVERGSEDLREEHALYQFLNTLEQLHILPRGDEQDKNLEELYALYILHPNAKGDAGNILGYPEPNLLGERNESNERALDRIDWAHGVIGEYAADLDKPGNLWKSDVYRLKQHFSKLAPLLRLEAYYQGYIDSPLGKRHERDGLPDTILDLKPLGLDEKAPFIDQGEGSPYKRMMGTLRAHSVRLTELGKYGTYHPDQYGFLAPFENHPSLEYLANPAHDFVDAAFLRHWIEHNEEALPEAWQMAGKDWEDIEDGRIEALDEMSVPGLLWQFATGGLHGTFKENGGWPRENEIVDTDTGMLQVPTYLAHFYYALKEELKVRSNDQDRSRELMGHAIKNFPRWGLNKFGKGTRCLQCRGAHGATVDMGEAILMFPRLQEEAASHYPDIVDEQGRDFRVEPHYIDEEGNRISLKSPKGTYDLENDPRVRQYVFDNLVPRGGTGGEEGWRKAYQHDLRHGGAIDEDKKPIPFEQWLGIQHVECPGCSGTGHCSSCAGHSHDFLNASAKKNLQTLMEGLVQADHMGKGLHVVDGHFVFRPETAIYRAPERDMPLFAPLNQMIQKMLFDDTQIARGTGLTIDDFSMLDASNQKALLNISPELQSVTKDDPFWAGEFKEKCPDCGELNWSKDNTCSACGASMKPPPPEPEGEPSDPDENKGDYGKMPRYQLIEIAKLNGLRKYSRLNKAGLIEMLEAHDQKTARGARGHEEEHGFFDSKYWPEDMRRRVLGTLASHRALVEGAEYGHEYMDYDKDGKPVVYPKGHEKEGEIIWRTAYGYEASKRRWDSGEGSVPALHKNTGDVIMLKVPQAGKGYPTDVYNKIPEAIQKKMSAWVDADIERRVQEEYIDKDEEPPSQGTKAWTRLVNAARKDMKKAKDEEGDSLFFERRRGHYYIPLLIDNEGSPHTLYDRKTKWQKDMFTEEELETLKKWKKQMQAIKQSGQAVLMEEPDPRADMFDYDSWDAEKLSNGVGMTPTPVVQRTSSYAHPEGNIARGKGKSWKYPVKKGKDPEELVDAADKVHYGFTDEQFSTPGMTGGTSRGSHDQFAKMVGGGKSHKRMRKALRSTMFTGMKIHGRTGMNAIMNAVLNRDKLKSRLQALGEGKAGDSIGVTDCHHCKGAGQIKVGRDLLPCGCYGGRVLRKGEEPLFKYMKFKGRLFFVSKGAEPIPATGEQVQQAMKMMHKLKRGVREKKGVLEVGKHQPGKEALLDRKMKELMRDDFRVFLPHPGFGSKIGHNPHYINFNKDEDSGKESGHRLVPRKDGFGDGFLQLHNAKAIEEFLGMINTSMGKKNPWLSRLSKFHTLCRKHLPDYEEGDEGTVTDYDGDLEYEDDQGGDHYVDIGEVLHDLKIDGVHKLDKSDEQRKEFEGLKKLRKYFKTDDKGVSNIERIRLGSHQSQDVQYEFRAADGSPLKGDNMLEEDRDMTSLQMTPPNARSILNLMESGSPFCARLPMDHRYTESPSDEQMQGFVNSVRGNRTWGIAPDARFDDFHRVAQDGQKSVLRHRVTHWPQRVARELSTATPETITDVCEALGLHPGVYIPREQELKIKNKYGAMVPLPDNEQQQIRQSYVDKLHAHANEAYAASWGTVHPSMGQYDYWTGGESQGTAEIAGQEGYPEDFSEVGKSLDPFESSWDYLSQEYHLII